MIPFSRFPFNTKNLLGYLIAIIIQFVQITCSLFVIVNLAGFGIGTFVVLAVINKNIKSHLNVVDKRIETNENHLELLQLIADFVRLHSNTIELSERILFIYN